VATAIELGCWAHARRRLVALQGHGLPGGLPAAAHRPAVPDRILGRPPANQQTASRGARRAAPGALHRSTPVLAQLRRWFGAIHVSEPPSKNLSQAADYALNHWTALTRFVTDGRVSLDNNLYEQQLRDIALGWTNFLFAGSHEAAERAAALYSLMRTCAQYGVPPLPYFTEVLTQLARGADPDRLDELLPHRWRSAEPAVPDPLPP
jgi:hypothetical protein